MREELRGNALKGQAPHRAGQGILEVLIAIAILTIGLSGAIAVIFGGQALVIDSHNAQQALHFSMQNLEDTMATARENFGLLAENSSTQGIFLKEILLEDVSPGIKKVTARTSWQTDPIRLQNVELVALAADWSAFIGGAPLFGDWQNPRTLGSIDLGPGNEGTDLKVRNGIVYMTGIASDAKKNDFFIIDATAPVTPVMRSQIDTGPGLNVVDVKGNYAYVGNRAATAHLQIIDVSNINGPFLAASIQLPGVSGSVFVKSVLIKDDTAYIGTDKNASGTEFFIYNVSDPLNPQQLGALEIGETVNAVAVQSGAAFLAMSGNPEVQSVDVSNPLNPFLIGTLDLAGTQGGLDLYLIRASTTAYLGRTVGTNKELVVLDLGDPSAMEVIGSIDITSDVNALVVKNPLAFLGTSEANSEFQVYYIDDPANITFWSSFNYPQAASGMDYENNTVYMSVRSNDALRIITSSP